MDDIQRAIETQKSIYDVLDRSLISSESAGLVFIPVDKMDDIKTAISAMQELQQYRQIGTIKEFRTYKEIIGKAEADELAGIIDGYLEYRQIGTPEECREAVEKQIPMKVTDVHIDEYYCPACGAENNCDQGKIGDKYCPECGQAIVQEGEERC